MFKVGWKRKKLRLARIILKNPMKKVTVFRVVIRTPRKPNSARRKSVKSFFRKGNPVFSYIPGGDNPLKKFANILIRGKGARDLPGVYTLGIRGVLDLSGVNHKKRRRSIYGVKRSLDV